jgi:hypothetical protein
MYSTALEVNMRKGLDTVKGERAEQWKCCREQEETLPAPHYAFSSLFFLCATTAG